MTHMVMLVGLPGSGKSSYLEHHYTPKLGYTRLSSDDYIESKAVELGKTYNEIFTDTINEAQKLYNESFNQLIKDKQKIVIDRTNLTFSSRKKTLARIPKEYYRTAIYFEPDLFHIGMINERRKAFGRSLPDNVIRDMIHNIEVPFRNEGFDEIIRIERFK